MKKAMKLLGLTSRLILLNGCFLFSNDVEPEKLQKIDEDSVVKLNKLGMTATDYEKRPDWTYSLQQFSAKR